MKYNRIIILSILVFVIFAFVYMRVLLGINHFTHFDDLYGPFVLRDIGSYSYDKIIMQLEKYGISKELINLYFNIMGEDFGLILLKYIVGPIAISKSSTYAPLQFYITGLLSWIDLDYKYTILLMRLPSILLSIIFMIVTVQYLKKIKIIKDSLGIILYLIFPVTSWMFLIYSSQAENYVIGLVFIPLILIYLQELEYIKYKKFYLIKLNLITAIGVFSTYQIIWFLPALLITYSFQLYKNKIMSKIQKIIFCATTFSFSILTFVLAYYIFIRKLLNERVNGDVKIGVSWNAGINNEFHYDFGQTNLFNIIVDFIKFIFKNANTVIWSMSGGGDYSNLIMYISNSIFVILFLIGYFISLTNKSLKSLSIFGTIAIATWIFFIAIGIFTFSPTRHSLIYMAIVWIYIGIALNYIFASIEISRYIKFFTLSCLMLIIFLFVFDFKAQYELRRNVIIELKLIEYIKKNNPRFIFSQNMTLDLFFDKYIKDNYEVDYIKSDIPYFQLHSKMRINDEIMFICMSQENCFNSYSANEIAAQKSIRLNEFQYNDLSSKRSTTSVCYGNYTINGTNEIKIEVYK